MSYIYSTQHNIKFSIMFTIIIIMTTLKKIQRIFITMDRVGEIHILFQNCRAIANKTYS